MKVDNMIATTYIFASFGMLAYIIYGQIMYSYTLEEGANYFRAFQNIMHEPLSVLLIYNIIFCLATIVYKLTVFLFFEQVKEMETMNMLEKIGYKLFEFFYFIYVIEARFGLQVFISIAIVFLLFIFHNLANFRAQYLIHTHTQDLFDLNYRLLAHFIILIFIDFQLIVNTFFWLFSGSGQGDEPYILFAYYSITIGLTIIEPAISFFIHFYEIYTDVIQNDSDLLQAKLNYVINSIRLVIQILLSLFIAVKFGIAFLFIITIFQSIYELSKIYKGYKQVNKFTQELKQLPTLNSEEINQKQDKTCAICYHDLTDEAVVLKKCQHLFHKQCLRQWIIKNSNKFCPKCKTPFESNQSSQINEQIGRLRERVRERLQEQNRNLQNLQREDPLGFKAEQKKKTQRSEDQQSKQKIQQKNKQDKGLDARKKSLLGKKIRPSTHRKIQQIGSVPFGLPTEAVYKRRLKQVVEREKVLGINQKMISLLKMDPAKQLLFVPEI